MNKNSTKHQHRLNQLTIRDRWSVTVKGDHLLSDGE